MCQAVDALEELASDPEVRRLAEKRRLDLVFYEMGLEMARNEERQKGLEQGRELGLEQGLAQGATSLLLRLLERKFGPLPSAGAARVQAAPLHDVERWSERILDAATLSDVFAE